MPYDSSTRHFWPRSVNDPSSAINPSLLIGPTMLSEALLAPAMSSNAATEDGVNLVLSAFAALVRSVLRGL